MNKDYDFGGWATKNDLKCSDGRTIRKDAFKHCDGKIVPLVWNHQHNDPLNVLGHALLVNKDDGVYTYGKFNDTEAGLSAKELVAHGDVTSLSIYANQLKHVGGDVIHGAIREVSLVLAGANPGACIDDVVIHGEYSGEEAIIYNDEHISNDILTHADDETSKSEESEETVEDVINTLNEKQKKVFYALVGMALNENSDSEVAHADDETSESEETVEDVINTLNEKQKKVLYALVGMALNENTTEGGNTDMKHNAFEQNENNNDEVLMHTAMTTIIGDAKRFGSMKESFIQHSQEYGIESIDYLFPDAKTLQNTPEFIKRQPDAWVDIVMNGIHKTPFSRIKSVFADITEDEARAKGYIKGKYKKEEVFSLLKRTTTPTTIYKKQKLDRDDVIDITDFDVVAWLKTEMRMMLNEEIARAVVFGDGRLASSDDKVNPTNIRPIIDDDDLFTIKYTVTPESGESDEHAVINAAVIAQEDYQGSGNLKAFMESAVITKMLLMEDGYGHRLYKNLSDIAAAMNVDRIVKIPKGVIPATHWGVIVDLNDYKLGADKGGSANMFDDFDIDYNQMKYLIETRCSGALVKPFSAIALKKNQ